ncbi:transcriptional regulator, MarR family [Alicyclobacillus hesperidum URH17-3-68]|nr:transcriptional regulator, MarR family [Alicyclobacillus hesperidum URH17-3-68]
MLSIERTKKLGDLLDKLGEDDARQFLNLLERMVEILDNECDAPCHGRKGEAE